MAHQPPSVILDRRAGDSLAAILDPHHLSPPTTLHPSPPAEELDAAATRPPPAPPLPNGMAAPATTCGSPSAEHANANGSVGGAGVGGAGVGGAGGNWSPAMATVGSPSSPVTATGASTCASTCSPPLARSAPSAPGACPPPRRRPPYDTTLDRLADIFDEANALDSFEEV